MSTATAPSSPDQHFLAGLARAFGGAIFFSLPILMIVEISWLGTYIDRSRLAIFMIIMVPVLIVLDHYSGFVETSRWSEDVLDGIIAYGVGIVSSAAALLLLNIIDRAQPPSEIIGRICLHAVPAALGAVLAATQLGRSSRELQDETSRKRDAGYGAELFFMVVGAAFLSFSVAPTNSAWRLPKM